MLPSRSDKHADRNPETRRPRSGEGEITLNEVVTWDVCVADLQTNGHTGEKKLIGVCFTVEGVIVKLRTESVGDGGRRSYDATIRPGWSITVTTTLTKLACRIVTVRRY